MPDIKKVQRYIEHKKLKLVATQVRGQDFVRLTLSKRDYPSQAEQHNVVSAIYEEFGRENIVPYVRR
jgi:hypothetical protein